MDLGEIIEESKRLGEWAHVATISHSGTPYVTPVHPCWEGEILWTMVGTDSVKAKNIESSPCKRFLILLKPLFFLYNDFLYDWFWPEQAKGILKLAEAKELIINMTKSIF